MDSKGFSALDGGLAPSFAVIAGGLAAVASRDYLFEYGWRTDVRGNEVLLIPDDDLAAVEVPAEWALLALAELRATGLACPVIQFGGSHGARCVFLLSVCPTDVLDQLLPSWLWRRVPGGDGVLLPHGDSRSEVTWLREPETARIVTVAQLGAVLRTLLAGRPSTAPRSA